MKLYKQSSLKKMVITFILLFSTILANNILIIRGTGNSVTEVSNSIIEDSDEEFNVMQTVLEKVVSGKKMKEIIDDKTPDLVVLMNKESIKSFKRYQKSLDKDEKKIPSVCMMTPLLNEYVKGLDNTAGISSEVPIVTSVVNLRNILHIDRVRLGVLYREQHKSFVDENIEYCKKENIVIKSGFIGGDQTNYRKLINRGLEIFVSPKHHINMLWVPNDPLFHSAEIIRDVWTPFAKKYSIPIIVGSESVLESNANFGSYAVMPDNIALGHQAVGIIRNIRDNNWEVEFKIVEPPISIYQVLNSRKLQKRYDIESGIMDVDKVIEQ